MRHLIKMERSCRVCVVILFVCMTLIYSSCRKLVEIEPPLTSLTGRSVYSEDATATSVLNGLYSNMGSGFNVYTGNNGISLLSGLSSDELILWGGGFDGTKLQQLYQNNLLSKEPLNYWLFFYGALLTVNSAIEGLEGSITLTPAVKKQLLGEAKFLRAFYHFYLVNFYGDIPLMVSSDWRVNSINSKSPKAQVYRQIIQDLIDAQNLLSEKYLRGDALTTYAIGAEQRVRPTKWAATALLARVYLFNEEWLKAEIEASNVIGNSLFALNTLDNAFKKNTKEAIWQIQYTTTGFGSEGFHFNLTAAPSAVQPTYLSNYLLNAFENGDKRKDKWVGKFVDGATTYFFPNKYKAVNDPNSTEYFMVLRIAEQYLIRAEARAHINKLVESQTDLNAIRTRAELSNTAANDKASLLSAILRERQIELFTEWGHRWFDIKRTGNVDSIMNIVHPTKRPGHTWNPQWQLYPIPFKEIQLNPNLAPNNPGY